MGYSKPGQGAAIGKSVPDEGKGLFKNGMEHGFGKTARIGVVARAMITVRKDQSTVQAMNGSVAKGPGAALFAQGREDGIMGYTAQGENDFQVFQGIYFPGQKRPAGLDFGAGWLVLRRDTTNGVGDPAVYKFQAIVGGCFKNSGCQLVFEERGVKQVTSVIAGERPSRAVCTAQARGQSDNKQFFIFAAERGHRAVMPIRIGFPIGVPESGKARA